MNGAIGWESWNSNIIDALLEIFFNHAVGFTKSEYL